MPEQLIFLVETCLLKKKSDEMCMQVSVALSRGYATIKKVAKNMFRFLIRNCAQCMLSQNRDLGTFE
jgi:hypothetical protein